MRRATIKTYAKLNLFLHITGKRAGGYHKLQSIFTFCRDIFDEITIEPSEKLEVTTTGITIEEKENLVYKTLHSLAIKAKIIINKKIPIGAGLGGASSNIGFLLAHLCKEGIIAEQNLNFVQIGADVAPCFFGKCSLVSGIGEIIERSIELPPIYAIILKPDFSLYTPLIYQNFEIKNILPTISVPEIKSIDLFIDFIQKQTNSLYEPAIFIRPEINDLVKSMKSNDDCFYSAMTGSGSAIFGLFEQKFMAELAARNLQKLYPNHFLQVTSLF